MTHKQRLLALFCTVPGLFACLPAMAQPTLYLGMNGGTMERLFSDNILPKFEQANGVKVVIVPAPRPTSWPRSRPRRTSRRSM